MICVVTKHPKSTRAKLASTINLNSKVIAHSHLNCNFLLYFNHLSFIAIFMTGLVFLFLNEYT